MLTGLVPSRAKLGSKTWEAKQQRDDGRSRVPAFQMDFSSLGQSSLSAVATDWWPTNGKSARPGEERAQTGSAAWADPDGRPQPLVRQSRWRWRARLPGMTFLRRSRPGQSRARSIETGFVLAPFLSAVDKRHWLVCPYEPEHHPS